MPASVFTSIRCEKSENLGVVGAPFLLSPFLVVVCLAMGCSDAKEKPASSGGTETVEPELPSSPSMAAASTTQGRDRQAPSRITLFALSDKRCTSRSCRTAPVIRQIQKMLPGLKVKALDFGSAEGKTLFAEEGVKLLPAYLFSESITDHPHYPKIKRHITSTPRGQLHQLKVKADFDPLAEICDNGVDDTGNGQVDCEDPTCKDAPVCRPEQKMRLDLFTMSMCPYGTQALDSMSEVLKALDPSISFRVHYIATEQGLGFRALHGPPEVDENIRELCAIKHYPKDHKYMDYIWCRNRKIKDPNWKACTGKTTGIDPAIIERCASGEEGKALLRESIKLPQKLKISASPTWLANNRFVFHAIAPEHIKQGLCKHNPGLKGCDKKLSTKSPVPNGVCN